MGGNVQWSVRWCAAVSHDCSTSQIVESVRDREYSYMQSPVDISPKHPLSLHTSVYPVQFTFVLVGRSVVGEQAGS